MKKLLFAVFALSSMVAMAESQTHFYGKLGVDLSTKYAAVKDDEDGSTLFKSSKGRGVGIFLEATRDVQPNLELGLGIGYIGRANGDDGSFDGIDEDDGTIYTVKYNTPRYNSVPLYVLAKYNFDIDSKVRPYVKADLGYSFNRDKKLDVVVGNEKVGSVDMEVKNGVYAGVGAGIEYNHFIAELSYHYTQAKMSMKIENEDVLGGSKKYGNHAVSLAVGYKF